MKLFIAGTDTNVGKTYVTVKLLEHFATLGWETLGIKPIASGCIKQDAKKLMSEDAQKLMAASTLKLPYKAINPIAIELPVAPHLKCKTTVTALTKKCEKALNAAYDICLIEGVGGWHVPLNDNETMADFVITNDWPVLLVVGMRLGCLNHALLTMQSMFNMQANVIGWIANCLEPEFQLLDKNIQTLTKWLPRPLLGRVIHGELKLEKDIIPQSF